MMLLLMETVQEKINNMRIKSLIVSIGMGVMFACSAREYRFVVIDEDTQVSMAGVPLRVRVWVGEDRHVPYDLTTDTNGVCSVTKKNAIGVDIYVKGDDTLYSTLLKIPAPEECVAPLVTTVGVRRVVNPVPLIVCNESYIHCDLFGRGGGVLRYDFFKGDFLPPVGTGVVADVEFRRLPVEEIGLSRRNNSEWDDLEMRKRDTMSVVFQGEGNGAVRVPDKPSSSLWLRTAPTNGYERSYLCTRTDDERMNSRESWEDGKTLCFRIRTKRNGKGEVVEAYYGKIYEDIAFDIANYVPIGSPRFLYYLNPNSMDTNLEYGGPNLRPGAKRHAYRP